jgi:hypothetical protein
MFEHKRETGNCGRALSLNDRVELHFFLAVGDQDDLMPLNAASIAASIQRPKMCLRHEVCDYAGVTGARQLAEVMLCRERFG